MPPDTPPDQSHFTEPSKSERKREAERLQRLGRTLGELSFEQLNQMSLPDDLHAALLDYQRFPSHGAKRRQLQFIGKLMRAIDVEPIEDQLAHLQGESAAAAYTFKQLEQWRDALINSDEALTQFVAEYPQVDRQQLRQAIKKVSSAADDTQRKKHAKALFRLLREVTAAP